MLVLSRRCGEDIVIPEHNLVFRITEVRGGRVRIGIIAPEHVRIYRREIWEQSQREQSAGRVRHRLRTDRNVHPTAK